MENGEVKIISLILKKSIGANNLDFATQIPILFIK